MGRNGLSLRFRAAGTLLVLAAAAVIVAIPGLSSAAPTPAGPSFPPPGGATVTYSPVEAAPPSTANGYIGKAGGSTATYTGFSGSFTHMWWGPDQTLAGIGTIPAFAFDNAIDTSNERLSLNITSGNSTTWGPGSSNLKYISGGAYTTTSVATRFRMVATKADNSAINFVSAASVGLPSNVGAVIPVPLSGGVPQSFKVMRIFEACKVGLTTGATSCAIGGSDWEPVNDLYNRLQTDPAISTRSSFASGFFYNRTPVALSQSVNTNEDTPLAITLTATDADANPLTYSVVSSPTLGTLSGSAPNLTYTPGANLNGSDSFTFKVNDGFVDSTTATINITVNPVNDPPVATPQSVTVNEDDSLGITLAGTDIENSPLTFEITQPPANGTLSGSPPAVTYAPGLNYNGPDSFKFRAFDGAAYSAESTVSITVTPVNDAPTAEDLLTGTPEDTPVSITVTGNDIDGDTLAYNVTGGPSHGVLVQTGVNTFNYVPNLNYNGIDTFTFVAFDGSLDSNEATVTIEIPAVNDAPVADDGTAETDEDTPVDITLVASDVDNTNEELSYSIVQQPANGTLVGSGANIQYVPNEDFNGTDTITFIVNDGEFDSNEATVTITVNAVNDAPVADEIPVETAEDNSIGITLTASDVDGDSLTYAVIDGPSHGSLEGTAPNLTYVPDENYFGPDSFTYEVSDGNLTDTATVSITVTPVNDAPTTSGQSLTTDEDIPLDITLTGADIENDALTFIVVAGPSHGMLSGSGASLTYTPFADYHGPDSFTFKVNDGELDSTVETITIEVASVNDGPVAGADTGSTPQYTSVTVNVLANDTDVDGDILQVFSVTDGSKGSAVVNQDGTITYTPNPSFKDSDVFYYIVEDPDGAQATGTVVISEIGCGENGVDHLDGAGSTTVDREVEPVIGGVDPDTAANVHAYNCAYVVPAEDAVDGQLP